MRDYTNIDKYLDDLQKDIYEQPPDPGHTDWAKDAIDYFLPKDVTNVLDVGCGWGFCKDIFSSHGVDWTGITIDEDDIRNATTTNVYKMDVSFLDGISDNSYDMVFARHILEHSPMPLLTLMEWHRVSKKYLLVILPAPEYWGEGGINHYYVLPRENWWYLFDRSGWKLLSEQNFTTKSKLFMKHYLPEEKDRSKVQWPGHPKIVEYRMLLEKK